MIANLEPLATSNAAAQNALERRIGQLELALQMVKTNLSMLTFVKTAAGQPNEPLVEESQNIITEALGL